MKSNGSTILQGDLSADTRIEALTTELERTRVAGAARDAEIARLRVEIAQRDAELARARAPLGSDLRDTLLTIQRWALRGYRQARQRFSRLARRAQVPRR